MTRPISYTKFRVHYYTQGARGGVPSHRDVAALNPQSAVKTVREALKEQGITNAVFTKTKVVKDDGTQH